MGEIGMRKVLLIAVLLTIGIAGCSTEGALNDFIDDYNENTTEFKSVEPLEKENFSKIREEEFGNWKTLFKSDGQYTLEAKYDKENKLTGYNLSISEHESYEDNGGSGYEASQVIAETLGIDRKKFKEKYEEALKNEESMFTNNGYEISFSDFNAGQMIQHGGMVINYDIK